MFGFAPGMLLYQSGAAHIMSHYVGGIVTIILGIIGLALYRWTNVVEDGVSILTTILGITFILEASGMLLFPYFEAAVSHALGMEIIGGITMIIGIIAGWIMKPKT